MDKVEIEKKSLRKKYKIIRENIEDKKIKSDIIFKNIIQTTEYKNAKIIAAYSSFGDEVDTLNLIEYSIKLNKIIALPRIIDNNLKFYRIYSLEDKMKKNKFGINEPIEDEENYIEDKEIDLVIIPGLCFDVNKNRLGFGRGFYDRFLESKNFKSIAICFEEQVIKEKIIPTTDKDIKVNKIITEDKIYM